MNESSIQNMAAGWSQTGTDQSKTISLLMPYPLYTIEFSEELGYRTALNFCI